MLAGAFPFILTIRCDQAVELYDSLVMTYLPERIGLTLDLGTMSVAVFSEVQRMKPTQPSSAA